MGAIPIHYVDVRAFCYATEDEPRVRAALGTVLPDGRELSREATRGHHGDRIIVLSARIDDADGIREVLDRVRGLEDLPRVLDELDERVDEDCSLFLRLDKQAAFQGRVVLGEGILLRAKVEAYPAKRDAAVENVRRALAG